MIMCYKDMMLQTDIINMIDLGKSVNWLVGCIEDLHRFSGISAILQLGSRR